MVNKKIAKLEKMYGVKIIKESELYMAYRGSSVLCRAKTLLELESILKFYFA